MSHIQFLNTTIGNQTPGNSDYGKGGLVFRIDFYNIYNNTGQSWLSNIFTWNINNDTILGLPTLNSLETLHIFSDKNITVNMTRNGSVSANWTIF